MSGERSLPAPSIGSSLWPRSTWPRVRLSPHDGLVVPGGAAGDRADRRWSRLPAFLFLVVSFFDYDRVGIYPAFLLDNYRELLTTPATYRVYVSSLRLSFIVWAITLFVGFNIAWFLVLHVRTAMVRTVLFLLCAVPFWTSGIIRTIAWIPFLGRNGAFNQILMALGIIASAAGVPAVLRLRGDHHLRQSVHLADGRPDRQLDGEDRSRVDRGRARCRCAAAGA